MTNQEIFNFVVDKMRQQNKQCANIHKRYYISPDKLLRSPVGFMIEGEDKYTVEAEKFAVTILFGHNTPLNETFVKRHKEHENLLIMMNDIHDMYEVERWEEGWKETAKKFNLVYSSPHKLVPEEEITPINKNKFKFLSRHTELLEAKEKVVKEMTVINNQALYVAEGFKHSEILLEERDITSIEVKNLIEAFAKYHIAVERYKTDTIAQFNKNKVKQAKEIPNGSKVKVVEKGVELFGHVASNKSRMGKDYVVVEWDGNFLCSVVETGKLEVLEGNN